ncbi:MAG: hypothetical protein ACK5RE_17985 [Pseudanabaena sp.]|jgi:hypothetical protein
MTHKYGAKPVYYNPKTDTAYGVIAVTAKEWKHNGGLYFPSTLEYETFRAIRAWFAYRKIQHRIELQHTLTILPATKSIKAITWCVDFKIDYKLDLLDPIPTTLYIEAKGIEMDDYKLKMNLLSRFHPGILSHVRVIRNSRNVDNVLNNTVGFSSR